MKKLLTIIVIIMTIAAVALAARSGDAYDLKKLLEFQNTIHIIGVADTSLTSSNEASATEEVRCTYLDDSLNSSMMYRENGGMGYDGITMVDEFRVGAKLADILFFADTIKLKVALNQRLYTFIEDDTGAMAGSILENLDFYFQYRSYLDMTMAFGNDVVKYTINPYIQMRMIFDNDVGIDSVRQYTYLGHKISIVKIMDIQQSTELMLRWYANTASSANVDSTLSLDLRFGSPGLAGGGAHYLAAFVKRAAGYNLGPVSLSWFIRLSLDLDMYNSRWKDTDPGSARSGGLPNVDKAYGNTGIMKHWKFRLRYAEVWVNPLKDVKLIDLNIGVSEYLQMEADWSYNNPYTTTVINELKMGAELVLDKAFVIGMFLKIRTTDFFNARGVPMNGNKNYGVTELWNNSNAPETVLSPKGNEYLQTIPMGRGLIGPNIYVGVQKGAFEWMFGWHGWTSFRDFDVLKVDSQTSYTENYYQQSAAGTPGYTAYNNLANNFNWRNELESWVTWKW